MSVVGEQVRESARAFGDVFRNPGLRRVNVALAASVVGDWAYSVAVMVWAYQASGATGLGVYATANYVVRAVSTPLTSTLADRYPRVAVMIGADVARAVLVFAGAVLIAWDAPALTVYALALATGVVGTAFRPAQAALLPTLADGPEELTGANVVASTIESVGFFAGPAIAGFLLAVADVPIVYAFNGLTFLWSAAVLVRLRVPERPRVEGDDADVRPPADADGAVEQGFVREATAGFRAIAADRDLRLIAGLMAAQTVVAGASMVYEVAIVLDLLEMGESGLGFVDSVLGVGGIVGGIVALALARRGRLAADFGIGVILWAAPLLLIVASPTLGATLVAMFLIGVANSLVDINAFTIIQRVSSTEVMGRVFGAVESIYIAGMAVGALVMPVLINTVGLRAGLAVLGAAVTAMAAVSFGRLVRIDRTALAPPALALLRGVPMLAVLPPPVLERLARTVVPLDVPAGRHVFRAGDPGDRFWVVERGRASVWIDGARVRDVGPGGSFGEIALIRDVPRTASVLAEEDLVLVGLERADFLSAVTGHGEALEVADATVNRLLTLG